MGPWGALIMSFFGGVFFVWSSVLLGGWSSPLLALPPIVFAVIAVVAVRMIRSAPSGAFEPDARADRIISGATIFEAVGVPVMAIGLSSTGHGDVVLPGIALVVGLHFLPMGYAIPFRAFYGLGAALVIVAIGGFVASQPMGSIVVGLLAACALWTASILALRRAGSSIGST